MHEFLRNLFASEQPVLKAFNVVDPTAVGANIRSLTLAYTPSTSDSPTSVVSLFWSDSKNKVYEKQFQDESQAQRLFGAMQGDLEQAARLSKEEKTDAASSLVSSLLKKYSVYTDEIVDPEPQPVTTTNADLVQSAVQNPLINKNAKVVMQNLFFETPEELMQYQEKLKGKNPQKGAPQVGDFKDDLKPLNEEAPMDEEMPGADEDGLAPSSLSYEQYEKGQADQQKSLTKRIEREVKDQVKSALEKKIASTFDESDDQLIDAMRNKGRTWEEIKEYFIKELKYDKDSVAAYIDALREAEHGGPANDSLTPPKKEEPLPSAPKPPEDLVSPETHDKLVDEMDAPKEEPKEIEKQDMHMSEIAQQDTEIQKIAEEPLETIPHSRPNMGQDYEFLPQADNMSDDMVEDPAPAPESADARDPMFAEKVNPGDKVYVMADYETGEEGYEGTLVSMYKQSGDEWAVIDMGNSNIKEVPMRMVKKAEFGRLVKFVKARKAARLAKEAAARKKNTELDRMVQEAVYGWQINIMDISKVYAVAEAAYRAGKDVKSAVTELLKMIAKPSDVPAAPGNPPMPEPVAPAPQMPTASDELKAITAELKSLEIEIQKEADSSVIMPMEYAITDKDVLAYANGSIYAKKIQAGEMTDEDWKILIKETGRWMPHVGAEKVRSHYSMDAKYQFDDSQIAKIKAMFTSLPAQSSLKTAGAECALCDHPKASHANAGNLAAHCNECIKSGRESFEKDNTHIFRPASLKTQADHGEGNCPRCGTNINPGKEMCDTCQKQLKQAAPGDPVAPVDPKAPIVQPVKMDVHKKAPPEMRKEEPMPATPEVSQAYNEVKDVMHKLELIERSTQGMLAKVSEEIKKYEQETGKSALIAQHKASLEKLFSVIQPMKAKVVEVEDSLLAVEHGTEKEKMNWTPSEQLKRVKEQFPKVAQYLENALNGLQSGAKEIEKRRLIMFPKSSKLSSFDKRASFEDMLKNVMDNLSAAFAAISAIVPTPEPTMAAQEPKLAN